MRTLTLVLVCLLLVTCAMALESGPSNKVGYVKVYCPGALDENNIATDSYQEFGLPFRFWDVPGNNIPTYGSLSTCPSDIVGNQANPGTGATADLVIRQDLGDYGYRNPSGVWSGFLELYCEMTPAQAYWFDNLRGYDIEVVLAGDADINTDNIDAVEVYAPGSTSPDDEVYIPYSWRDARELGVDQLGLLEQGFLGGLNASTSDYIVQQGLSGFYAWYKSNTSTWMGLMNTVVPGESYWITNKHPTSDYWYTFASPPALGQMPTSKPASAAIAKFKHSLVKKAPVKAHTTER